MKLKSFSIFFLGLLVFSFAPCVFAATITVQNGATSLGSADEYTVDTVVSIGSANGTQYFLRGAFYQDGTTNYCGYTYNGSDWYNGPYTTNSGWLHLLPITITSSSWSGQLKAKLDLADAGCANSGIYHFKIERFTASGNGTFDSQTEQTLTVILPTATPTPVPTSTPTAMPVPTAIKSTATPTQKPTIASSPTKVAPIVPSATDIPAGSSGMPSTPSGVLGASASSMPTLVAGIADKKETTTNMWAIVFILGGILLLSACGILVFILRKKGMLWYGSTNQEC